MLPVAAVGVGRCRARVRRLRRRRHRPGRLDDLLRRLVPRGRAAPRLAGGRVERGQVLFEGTDLTKLSEATLRRLRGKEIAMVFQDPMTSLNPVLSIEEQVVETITAHRRVRPEDARARAVELLDLVGIPRPQEQLRRYPHQFSGGMRQRVMIAIALALQPKLLIADEPTTALDVTVQAQILELIQKLTAESGTAVILISHDLGVVARTTQHVAVMYAGFVVESAGTSERCAPSTASRSPSTAGRPSASSASPGAGSRRSDARSCGSTGPRPVWCSSRGRTSPTPAARSFAGFGGGSR